MKTTIEDTDPCHSVFLLTGELSFAPRSLLEFPRSRRSLPLIGVLSVKNSVTDALQG